MKKDPNDVTIYREDFKDGKELRDSTVEDCWFQIKLYVNGQGSGELAKISKDAILGDAKKQQAENGTRALDFAISKFGEKKQNLLGDGNESDDLVPVG